MKTATQEVIAKMQEAKENFPNIGFDDEFIRGFNKAFQMAIFITEKVGLPKEKEQIINSCYAGKLMQCREGDKTPQEYYDSNFGDKVEEAGI